MLDFLMVSTRVVKSVYEIYPRFIVRKSNDLMIKGHDFYAIWVQERGLWSTDEFEAFALIDQELDIYFDKNKDSIPQNARILHMWDADSGMVDKWHKFCQSQMRDNFVMLDETIVFADMETKRESYASRKLSYPFGGHDISSWDRIVGTLYDESERFKIEWAIGAIVSGASKSLQKFFVFYGAPGSGKSTILNIIQRLFEDYATTFRAKDLTAKTNTFALEAFRSNPLISIEHDGDLSRIEDNSTLNSLIAHEPMLVNEKYKSTYTSRFWTLLFMGTNKPVKITDSKSGLLRRLIDIHPNENKLEFNEYTTLMSRIEFELGGIVEHCLNVYNSNPTAFNDYVPLRMMEASNDLYNFLLENYYAFEKADGVSLRDAWDMYKQYCEDSNVGHPMTKRAFKEEMRLYFREYYERNPDGRHQLDWYKGFRTEKFESKISKSKTAELSGWLRDEDLIEQHSLLDDVLADCKAQYANNEGAPSRSWSSVKTTLSDLDSSKLHYVQNPENHIVIDCDLKDENGNKDVNANIRFALSLPPTYCEVSKGGGLHLHYIYTGDISLLTDVYIRDVEIKKRSGNSAIRRKLTRCNALPIATISSGLPLKGEKKKKMVNVSTIKNENALRKLIIKNLNKEVHADTRSSIDFIKHLLDQAYESGMHYDLRDLQNDIYNFASRSTNQSEYCLQACLEMKFCSDEEHFDGISETDDAPFCFFDIEIFPNLFILVWKLQGAENKPVVLINPDYSIVREFCTANMRRIGFNNRRYDNHLIYAYAYRNYSVGDLYRMSQAIINSKISKYFIGEAYNLSYTDIYDFASANNKKSLKKLEIEMGIHHQEFGHPWDEPLAPEFWEEAGEYCCNDVIATEAAFEYLHADYLARVILADIADMLPNNTTNQLSMRIVFGNDRNPQSQFNYRDMSQPVRPDNQIVNNMGRVTEDFMLFDEEGCPTGSRWDGNDIPEGWSLLPFFPGYLYEFGKSEYRGTIVGEGGYVYAEPGMYRHISLLDIASMHPSSIIAECLFGPKYTARFESIVNLRIDIKHGAFDEARQMFDGKLVKWLEDTTGIDGLSDALKTVINSAYGLTSASFENLFRDPRNIDNIVAKRGALFMRNLQSEVQARGFTVAHIKTDSIKIPKATPELIDFVMEYGRAFGYNFEYEACYDCMTLVNDAVYIARYDSEGIRNKGGKKAGQWTATGAQFAVPYVFKTLFTHDDLEFNDLCETFSTQSAIYLDINEKLEEVSQYEKELKKLDPKDQSAAARIAVLKEKIGRGHNYCFVGRCGQFCPIQEGSGGGYLYRIGKNKYGENTYSFVSKTSGRRWMESENVKALGLEEKIDMTYFEELARDAIATIENYGGFEWFANHDLNDPYDEILPF